MLVLDVKSITRSYGEKTLFDAISFQLSSGEKAGIIARNGAGKTTMLNIITGHDSPDSGTYQWMPDCRISYLNQQDTFDKHITIQDVLLSSDTPQIQAILEYEHFLASNPDLENFENLDKLQILTSRIDALGAWDFEQRIKTITSQLRIPDFQSHIASLSGGQKKRLALAKALVQEADVYILDEPTNHLDFDMIEWLELYLGSLQASIILVTHDRYFLESVCSHIWEIEDSNMYVHPGNYAVYLENKSLREQINESTAQKAKGLMKVELEWLRRQPKARTTKSKARIDAFDAIEATANSIQRKTQAAFDLRMSRLGGKVMELHNVKKKFGDIVILDGYTYTFKRAEKLGIVGKNGTGKSSFLKLLTEEILPDSGKVQPGDTIVFGHFRQDGIHLSDDKTVLDSIQDIADHMDLGEGRTMSAEQLLVKFNFPYKQHRHLVRKLSGGEKKRLQLLMVLMKAPNFLILDEPTNDLDIPTLQILEDFLAEFGGCLIIVSHDRYFLDRLADHLFIFMGNGEIKDFNGNYTDYQDYLKSEEQKAAMEAKQVKPSTNTTSSDSNKGNKLTFKEKQEYSDLELQIANLEQKKEELSHKMNAGDTDFEQLAEFAKEFKLIEGDIAEKETRWLDLADRMD